ncbi:MAG: sensor histidine kinase [Aggregatilineales bacterium]
MTTNPKETLINELRAEHEQIGKRLREIQSMIDQSQAEFRRLQQRSVEVTTQMRRIEDNFDTVPRNDIKVVYTAALDTRTRLLTSQAQLEKLQQDRAQLEHFGAMLNKLLNSLEGVALPNLPAGANQQNVGESQLSDEVIIRLVQSQESERQRLARQMHDGPAQSLTNFILQAEICRRLFDRDPSRATEELENLKTAASTTFQRVRDFIFELRPMMLDDLGLVPTMRRYVDVFMDKSGIETRINVVGEERRRLESHTEVTFFRSLQELLAYARDNAHATKIDIVLDITSNPAKASVTFNGQTIAEIEEAVEQNKGKMFGLASLAERIELVGGQIEFQSIEGEPNRVEIALPAHAN